VAENNPEDASAGKRKLPFSRILYVEREDFAQDPPKKWFRLAPGREVRLKHAYYVTCTGVVRDESTGEVFELHCTYDPATRGGWSDDGRKVRGTLHWVSAAHSVEAEVRLYDRLFTLPYPLDEDGQFLDYLNSDSLEVLTSCRIETSVVAAQPWSHFQFLRKGYFCVDPDSARGSLIFNRTASLRDTWAKIRRAQAKGQ